MEQSHFVGLKDFIAQTLKDIKAGSAQAGVDFDKNKSLGIAGSLCITDVKFDLAVAASEMTGNKTKGGLSVKVVSILQGGGAGEKSEDMKYEATNKISFSIPIILEKSKKVDH